LQYYIGTSGWHYDHWRQLFYPDKLPRLKWLEFYSRHFSTVELNNSFYRLPSEEAFTNWYNSSPANFAFAVKVSRFITHIRRLKNSEEPVDTFLSRAKILKEKLGPLLYQLPPSMHRDDDRLESFLSILPKGLKHTLEFRHQSWLDEVVFEILRRHNAGLCVFDMPGLTCPLVATADFAYIRFHGSTGLYSSCYSDEELAEWARRLAGLTPEVKAVYIYFNNDAEAFAVRNAMTLGNYLKRGVDEL
jgi:uncharacterized protein YecE (DUF72 family)